MTFKLFTSIMQDGNKIYTEELTACNNKNTSFNLSLLITIICNGLLESLPLPTALCYTTLQYLYKYFVDTEFISIFLLKFYDKYLE